MMAVQLKRAPFLPFSWKHQFNTDSSDTYTESDFTDLMQIIKTVPNN